MRACVWGEQTVKNSRDDLSLRLSGLNQITVTHRDYCNVLGESNGISRETHSYRVLVRQMFPNIVEGLESTPVKNPENVYPISLLVPTGKLDYPQPLQQWSESNAWHSGCEGRIKEMGASLFAKSVGETEQRYTNLKNRMALVVQWQVVLAKWKKEKKNTWEKNSCRWMTKAGVCIFFLQYKILPGLCVVHLYSVREFELMCKTSSFYGC